MVGGKEPTMEVEEMTSGDNGRRKDGGGGDKTISKKQKKQEKMSELDMTLHNLGYRITQSGKEG